MRTSNQTWQNKPSGLPGGATHPPLPVLAAIPGSDSDVDGPGSTLRVHLLYEDAEAGLRGRLALDSIAPALQRQAHFEIKVWPFDALNDPGLRELACCELAEADILFLAVHGHADIPAHVRHYVEGWLTRPPAEPRALVLSLDAAHKSSAAAERNLTSLQVLARLAEVEVIPHFFESSERSDNEARGAMLNSMVPKSSPSEDFLDRRETYAHWGLNE